MNKNNKLNVRFASKEEGQQLILGNTQYYNRLTQVDIDWRARKENATLDELISFAQSQVLDFTEREIDLVFISLSTGFINSNANCLFLTKSSSSRPL